MRSSTISGTVAAHCACLAGSASAQAADAGPVPVASVQIPTGRPQVPTTPTIAIPLFVDATGYLAVDVPGMPGTQSGFAVRSKQSEVVVGLDEMKPNATFSR